jgi:hypothetical protein
MDPDRDDCARLACLSAWVDQCEASVRDALAGTSTLPDRIDVLRCQCAALRARSVITRVGAKRTAARTRELLAASRRNRSTQS